MNKFLLGLLFGITIAGLVVFYVNNSSYNAPKSKNNASDVLLQDTPLSLSPSTSSIVSSESDSGRKYDFYDILSGEKQPTLTESGNQSEYDVDYTAYFILVASFEDKDTANSKQTELIERGYDVQVINDTRDSVTKYEVLLGPFDSVDQTSAVKKQLLEDNINGEVVQRIVD